MQPCKNLYAFIWIGDQRLLPFSFGPKLFCPPAFLSVIIFEGILPLTSPQVIELKFNVIYDVQLVTINRRNRKQIISKNLLLLPSLSLHVRNKQLTRFYLYKTICKMPFCFCVQFGRRLDGAGGVGHQMQWARPRSWQQTNIIPNFLPLLHPKKVDPLKATATQIAVTSDHSRAVSAPLKCSADLPLVTLRCWTVLETNWHVRSASAVDPTKSDFNSFIVCE